MKLNLGCGYSKLDGFLNVDIDPHCMPDVLVDLECIPWPFIDDCVDEVSLIHVLEHLGETKDKYFSIIQELFRVSRDKGKIRIIVPHPRHDHFINDPTHIRPIMPEQFYMFSKTQNRELRKEGCANSNFSEYLGVDFDVTDVQWVPDDLWLQKIKDNEITSEKLVELAQFQYNIVREIHIELRVIKQ